MSDEASHPGTSRLILGGEKSGKSAHALDMLLAAPGPRLMLAMGRARDLAFRKQLLDHRAARPADIPVAEPGVDLPGALARARAAMGGVLVDSVDFWLFERVMDGTADTAVRDLEDSLTAPGKASTMLVSCEAGLGPIAADAATRSFVRRLGALNQALARACTETVLVVAGMPLVLPGPRTGTATHANAPRQSPVR